VPMKASSTPSAVFAEASMYSNPFSVAKAIASGR
jgi:hypothetical protein